MVVVEIVIEIINNIHGKLIEDKETAMIDKANEVLIKDYNILEIKQLNIDIDFANSVIVIATSIVFVLIVNNVLKIVMDLVDFI